MATIADFERSVENLSQKSQAERTGDDRAKIKELIRQICSTTWQTKPERDRAQVLVGRLSSLANDSA